MYKILVVDDQIDLRKDYYSRIFESYFDYELFHSEEYSIISKLKDKYFDCIIVDENLDTGDDLRTVLGVIKSYGIPIILISEKRSFQMKDFEQDDIIDCISLIPVFRAIQFSKECSSNTDLKDTSNKLCEVTIEEFNKRIESRIRSKRGKDNSLRRDKKLSICHISDIQIGDPTIRNDNLINFFSMLKTFFNMRQNKPDLFVFSGDIIFSGKYDDFDEKVISSLKDCFRSIYMDDDWKKHIIFVPGNHDYCYSESIIHNNLNNLEFIDNFKLSNKINSNELIPITPSDFTKFESLDIGRYYFSKFCYQITNNREYWSDPFLIENNNYMDLGFRIIGISNSNAYFSFDGNDQKLYEFRDIPKLNKKFPINIPAIIIGHVSPSGLGYENLCNTKFRNKCRSDFSKTCNVKGNCEKWESSRVFFESTKGLIYLYGHGHNSDGIISKDKKILFLGAAAPNKINSNESSFSLLSFNNNLENNQIMVTQTIISNQKGHFENAYNQKYLYNEGTWILDEN